MGGLDGEAATAAVCGWLVVPSGPGWEDVDAHWFWYCCGVSAAIFAGWNLLDTLVSRGTGRAEPWLLALVAVAGGMILERSGSGKFAQIAGALAAGLSGHAVVSLRRPSPEFLRGAIPVLTVLIVGLMFTGRIYTFADVPWLSFALVAASPLALWCAQLGAWRDANGWRRGILQSCAVLVPLAVAIVVAAGAGYGGQDL